MFCRWSRCRRRRPPGLHVAVPRSPDPVHSEGFRGRYHFQVFQLDGRYCLGFGQRHRADWLAPAKVAWGAMVQIGQKDLLIDTQGNWGNILTCFLELGFTIFQCFG